MNIEKKNERRRLIIEELKNVPDGERIKINKDLLEELLFDVDDVYGYKFPTWTGDFLSKIDLSEISFKDVSFDGEAFCETNLASEEYEFFEFRNTNAVINVDEIQEPGGLAYCDFSGTKVVGKLVNTYKCNFVNCGLTANNFSKDYEGSANNFMGNDLSGLTLTNSMISGGIGVWEDPEFNNYKDTGAILPKDSINIIYSPFFQWELKYYSVDQAKNIVNGFKGCNIDLIKDTVEEDIYNNLVDAANSFDEGLMSEEEFKHEFLALPGVYNEEGIPFRELGNKSRR